jgi:putative nucleotidyltransferase with HDIG domain
MLFPDAAPPRFRTARKAGNVKELRRRIIAAGDDPETTDLAEMAELVLALSTALSNHDRKTRGHSERTRAYTDMLAEEMGLPEPDRDRLRWAALLHDVGKLEVPTEILNKDSSLDPEEWELIRQHPVNGMRLVAPLVPWLGEWAKTIEHHHERYDGTGYPHGLSGEEICLGARIVTVADAFDVMTSGRSYQTAMSPAAARREIVDQAGVQFDPDAARALMTVSLGRLRWSAGPLAALAQIPIFRGGLPQVGRDLAMVLTTSAVMTTGFITGALPRARRHHDFRRPDHRGRNRDWRSARRCRCAGCWRPDSCRRGVRAVARSRRRDSDRRSGHRSTDPEPTGHHDRSDHGDNFPSYRDHDDHDHHPNNNNNNNNNNNHDHHDHDHDPTNHHHPTNYHDDHAYHDDHDGRRGTGRGGRCGERRQRICRSQWLGEPIGAGQRHRSDRCVDPTNRVSLFRIRGDSRELRESHLHSGGRIRWHSDVHLHRVQRFGSVRLDDCSHSGGMRSRSGYRENSFLIQAMRDSSSSEKPFTSAALTSDAASGVSAASLASTQLTKSPMRRLDISLIRPVRPNCAAAPESVTSASMLYSWCPNHRSCSRA